MTKAWKQANFENNRKLIATFARENDIKMQLLNTGYQIRLGEVLDLYPVAQRYHILSTGERGNWADIEDIKNLLMAAGLKERNIVVYDEAATIEPSAIDKVQQILKKGIKRRHWWQIWKKRW